MEGCVKMPHGESKTKPVVWREEEEEEEKKEEERRKRRPLLENVGIYLFFQVTCFI